MEIKEEHLEETEKQRYIDFHKEAYKEDMQLSEKLLNDFPRWSIISGYYAMHDIAKLYLGKIHLLKITGENVHAKTLALFAKYVKADAKKAVQLLEEAKNKYDAIISSHPSALIGLLSKGKEERGKAQYYSGADKKSSFELLKAANYFSDNFVKPFIEIIEGML